MNTIYFIGPEGDDKDAIKIGMTSGEPKKRLAGLQTGHPKKLQVIGTIKVHAKYERALHELFNPLRLHGEWFEYRGKLRNHLWQMQVKFGCGQQWPDYDFWTLLLTELREPEDQATAHPQALAKIDRRILKLFPTETGQ